MKVNDNKFAIFHFFFKNVKAKQEAYINMQEFLNKYGWLDSSNVKGQYLHSKHSESNGMCEVILSDGNVSEKDVETYVDLFFDDLKFCDNVKKVFVMFNEKTEKIVMNNMDYYPEYNMANMEHGDYVCVYSK